MERALEQLEAAAWRVGRRRFPAGALRPGALAGAAAELSRLYARRSAPPAGDAALLPARLLFFTVSELPKWVAALAELGAPVAPASGSLDVLDLGAGCGAATLGLLLARLGRSDAPLRVQAVDRDAAGLELLAETCAELATEEGWPPSELRLVQQDLGRGLPAGCAEQSFQLVLLGNLLGELTADAGAALVRQALARLAPGGHLLVLEPALRETSRALHRLRDLLLEEGRGSVLAPCTRQGPCPALLDPDDWCHESRPFRAPPRLEQLSRLSGLRRRELRFSFLALAAGSGARPGPGPGAWRVVSEPLVSKGKREQFLCGEAGRVRAVLLGRHRSAANAAFRELQRGQLCWIQGASVKRSELRLDAESRVEMSWGGEGWRERAGARAGAP